MPPASQGAENHCHPGWDRGRSNTPHSGADSIGKDTIAQSLRCLRPRGTLVSFGVASGPTPPIDLAELGTRGSLYVTRASIAHYTTNRQELLAGARALFDAIAAGAIRPAKITRYALKDVQQAHRDLESARTRLAVCGKSAGKTVQGQRHQ